MIVDDGGWRIEPQGPAESVRLFEVSLANLEQCMITYRIPSVIVTPKGTVLAFREGRKKSRGDAGDIDLVLKRSSDGGKTWSTAQIVWDDSDNTCGNHCPVIDRDTGTIWLLLTHNLGKDTEAQIIDQTSQASRTCWVSKSADGGVTWTKPVEDPALIEPVCQAGILRFWHGISSELNCILFSNPASTKREKLSVRASFDEGKTWAFAKLLHEGPAAYSCLTVLPDRTIGCLYERGDQSPYERITFARFSLDWLTSPSSDR